MTLRTTGTGTTMRVAAAQLAAHDLDDAAAALDEALDAVAEAGRAGAELCVLPEATYPAYVLGSAAAARAVIAAGPDPVAAFADAARRAACGVVVGLALEAPPGPGRGGLENAALFVDATGAVRLRCAKRFLWHFDRSWFVPGAASDISGDLGILVCADARLPEIGADLAARGARIIANPTAWVTSARPPEGTNSQAEFLWRVRALENRVVAIAATKVGTEAASVIYAGRSQIVTPDGEVVALASATAPELLVSEVELPVGPAPAPRAAGRRAEAPTRPAFAPGFVQVAVLTDDDLLAQLDGHAVELAVGPSGVLRNAAVGGTSPAVATFVDDELLDPTPARAAAFAGAEFVVWIARRVSTGLVETVARTRALENRVFVLLWRPAAGGGPCVVDPNGAVVARAGGPRFAVEAACLRAAAASKAMAPGTDPWDAVGTLGLARNAFGP
jgi:predicted amidohydrolase